MKQGVKPLRHQQAKSIPITVCLHNGPCIMGPEGVIANGREGRRGLVVLAVDGLAHVFNLFVEL